MTVAHQLRTCRRDRREPHRIPVVLLLVGAVVVVIAALVVVFIIPIIILLIIIRRSRTATHRHCTDEEAPLVFVVWRTRATATTCDAAGVGRRTRHRRPASAAAASCRGGGQSDEFGAGPQWPEQHRDHRRSRSCCNAASIIVGIACGVVAVGIIIIDAWCLAVTAVVSSRAAHPRHRRTSHPHTTAKVVPLRRATALAGLDRHLGVPAGDAVVARDRADRPRPAQAARAQHDRAAQWRNFRARLRPEGDGGAIVGDMSNIERKHFLMLLTNTSSNKYVLLPSRRAARS